MKTQKLFENESHSWLMFGRDLDKPAQIIDTNQYIVITKNNALLMDPGGIELFSAMLSAVIKQVPADKITHLFASHQDPDIISSLGLWDQALPSATLHSPWLWESFLRHFGMESITYSPIPDEGNTLRMDGVNLEFIPAHYLHSSGNFNVYDGDAKILNPSAENIAILIYNRLIKYFEKNYKLKITLFETPRNFVEYSG